MQYGKHHFATCRPTRDHTGRLPDYFIVTDWIAPLVYSVELVQGDVYEPHCIVRLTLAVTAKDVYEYRFRRPFPFSKGSRIRPRDEVIIVRVETLYSFGLEEHAKW